MLVLNNLFVDSSVLAIREVDGDSRVAYSLFWNNVEDLMGSNVDNGTLFFADPELMDTYRPSASSPAIDAGVASYRWNGETVTIGSYSGEAPDLGAFEVR